MTESKMERLPGAFVISLDFELHWGFCDHRPLDDALKAELLNARRAAERILALFAERKIHASWATVGFLMLQNREQMDRTAPQDRRPVYSNGRLDSYRVSIGENEAEDPYHYATSLVKKIIAAPGQEPASHTFSHYYCLEPGQNSDSFRADTKAAAEAAGLHGIQPRSIVFPRNQHNPAYSEILREHGIAAYRGNPEHRLYRAAEHMRDQALCRRAGRLLDTYVNLSGDNLQSWEELDRGKTPLNIRASRFLRPWSAKLAILEPLKIRRIRRGIRKAAETGSIFHLWWHPHNFAANTEKNLANLSLILDEFENCRERYGMRTLNIGEIVDMVGIRTGIG